MNKMRHWALRSVASFEKLLIFCFISWKVTEFRSKLSWPKGLTTSDNVKISKEARSKVKLQHQRWNAEETVDTHFPLVLVMDKFEGGPLVHSMTCHSIHRMAFLMSVANSTTCQHRQCPHEEVQGCRYIEFGLQV